MNGETALPIAGHREPRPRRHRVLVLAQSGGRDTPAQSFDTYAWILGDALRRLNGGQHQ